MPQVSLQCLGPGRPFAVPQYTHCVAVQGVHQRVPCAVGHGPKHPQQEPERHDDEGYGPATQPVRPLCQCGAHPGPVDLDEGLVLLTPPRTDVGELILGDVTTLSSSKTANKRIDKK